MSRYKGVTNFKKAGKTEGNYLLTNLTAVKYFWQCCTAVRATRRCLPRVRASSLSLDKGQKLLPILTAEIMRAVSDLFML